jgi:tetratricopeptide (TPR) repeat protein
LNRNIEISPEEFEIIEQYIFKQMPTEEYKAFEEKLLTDELLREKVNTARLLLLGVQEASLTDKIQDFHGDMIAAKKNNKVSNGKIASMKRWLVAASVIVIAGLGALLFYNGFDQDEKLFNQFYQPDPGLITAMGSSDNYTFDRAMIDYKTHNYESAIRVWDSLLTIQPKNDTLNYFIGSAYIAEKNSTKAISYFQKVITDTSSYFVKDAYWYTGLALLKDGKEKEAIPFIEKSEHQDKEALLLKLKE